MLKSNSFCLLLLLLVVPVLTFCNIKAYLKDTQNNLLDEQFDELFGGKKKKKI